MISQTAPVKGLINISFTLPHADLAVAIQTIGKYNKANPTVRTDVYADITKLTVEGMNMETQAGVAARLFDALATCDVRIKIITTSETKISCVVNQKDESIAMEAVVKAFCKDI
ncbi:MAG TPA: ACT domain-containing protein [Bacillota bacterium]|nr:ACT domain-containing protein [Bacillota bacterium]